eukprot:9471189-Pyramimonas_sp.AAC.2
MRERDRDDVSPYLVRGERGVVADHVRAARLRGGLLRAEGDVLALAALRDALRDVLRALLMKRQPVDAIATSARHVGAPRRRNGPPRRRSAGRSSLPTGPAPSGRPEARASPIRARVDRARRVEP